MLFRSEDEYEQSYDSDEPEDEYEQNSDELTRAYKILGIAPNATLEQIKTRFRDLIKQVHPDRNKSPDATERTREILKSYELIMTSRGEVA